MYNLLSKPIYFHPPGMKPSLKPAALTQPPEKPLNFTHSGLIHFLRGRVLIVASVSDFDYRSELFQPGGVSEAEWCKNPSPPPTLTKATLLSSSCILCHSQQRAAPLPGWCWVQTASVSINPLRERWRKKTWEEKRERESQEEE